MQYIYNQINKSL